MIIGDQRTPELSGLKYDRVEISLKRAEIMRQVLLESQDIRDVNLKKLSVSDLKLLFGLYDRFFFQDWFSSCFKGAVKFSLSTRMTKSAGLTLCPKNIARLRPEELALEIRMGVDFFFHYDTLPNAKSVCGIKTGSSLEALLLVFEHELCHVIEFISFGKSSCKAARFKSIANSLFGHTDSYHRLPTHRQIARQKLGIKIGDSVTFSLAGTKYNGVVYNINKRATVMVRDRKGILVDRYGTRYSKYYVPLSMLK